MSAEQVPDAEHLTAEPGDDLHRLLEVVQDWARRALPAPPDGHPGPECRWCPLCRLASVLRGEHPELLEQMAQAGTAVTDAVQALAESAAARAPGEARTAHRPRPRPHPRVQRITLTDTADQATRGHRPGANGAEPEEDT